MQQSFTHWIDLCAAAVGAGMGGCRRLMVPQCSSNSENYPGWQVQLTRLACWLALCSYRCLCTMPLYFDVALIDNPSKLDMHDSVFLQLEHVYGETPDVHQFDRS